MSSRRRNSSESQTGVTLTNPDKVLWPDAGDRHPVTKRDLAEYFAAIGAWMLPHLKGRPCSIVRAPDGIGGERFFQRHLTPGMSARLGRIKLTGDAKPYIDVSSLEGLLAVAQTAGPELHPGGCLPGKPEVPGRLVFDLDPAADVTFDAVIRCALEFRERLAALGLASFCKTTGGKGLHVVTPLADSKRDALTWPAAKEFARAVCQQIADDSPGGYVLNMSKKARAGRIFLDYLRNDRLSTAIAPLSPRARPGAPVSMPLEWADLRTGLDPAKFNVRTAPVELKKKQPWQEYDDAARPLKQAIAKVLRGSGAVKSAIKAPARRTSRTAGI